jgi:hypothetical protein
MHENTPFEPPLPGGPQHTYLPYFYESGLYRLQSLPSTHAPADRASVPRSGIEFFPPHTPWQIAGERPTVEQIIADGYLTVPGGDPETALITDRRSTSWLGLDDLIGQIRTRHVLYQQNMVELAYSVCEADNAVHRQVGDQGCPADNRQRYAADKRIQDLYEQMRGERVKLWQDVSRLRQTLPESAQSYLAAHRKLTILYSPSGDGP